MQILCNHQAMSSADMKRLEQAAGEHVMIKAGSREDALELAPASEAILGGLSEEVFESCRELKWFQSGSAGMDQVLFPSLIESDVQVTNMAGLYAQAGAEQAWGLWLALARGIGRAMEERQQRIWQPGNVYLVTGSTVLILGMGGFGQEIVKRAPGYELEILALDPVQKTHPGVAEIRKPSEENLHEWLPRADAVMVACPRTPETYHLIGAPELQLMQKSAYLINVSRGGIIDENALCRALHEGEIAGAGLDVVEHEPLPADSLLWDAPNFIMTPHRAGFSQDRHQNVVDFFCENVRRYVSGQKLLNIVDKGKGY